MIEFAKPWFLAGLFLIPLFYFWYKKKGQQQEGTLRISSKTMISEAMLKQGRIKIQIIRAFRGLTMLLIILGLAQPRMVDSLQEIKVEVVDIVLVIDISSSMLATDFNPNRLESVKKTARAFIQSRTGDRMGLLIFAGETFIQCPLTVDADVVTSLLSKIVVAEQSYDGTAIGMAIANATNRLRNSEAESKVIILLSDGSNNAGELDPLTAADLASQFNIRIYTIGAGTNQSVSYIPGRGYIRNEIDEKTLIEIAKRTNGQYFRATNEAALEDIYARIDELEKTEIEVREYTRYREMFGWFLIPALLSGLCVETLDRTIFRRQS